ncbi:MAG: hypothetical protein U5Q16_08365 [Gammaproteobacteria bacterium]|nr:hypothetical protein [Gammaproteobacteria bacterium]
MPSSNTPPTESPAAPRRRRRWLWAAGVMALLLLALYAAAPPLIATLAPRLAGSLGLDALSLRVTHPGVSGVSVQEMRVVTGRTTLTVERGAITYGLSGLLGGRLDAVVLEPGHRTLPAMTHLTRRRPRPYRPPTRRCRRSCSPCCRQTGWKIRELTLTVPALDFTALGHLNVTPAELHLELVGHTPPEADPFQLNARLTSAGLVELELQDRQQPGAPLLSLSSTLSPDSLDVTGEFDLHGFAFDLAAALAGAPAGSGAVRGQIAANLPWPLPADLQAAAMRAGGTLQAHWRPAPGTAGATDWEIAEAEAAWNLEAGALSGTAGGLLRYGGQDVQLDAAVARFVPAETEGHGTLAVSAVPAEAPFLDLSWALTLSALTVDGTFEDVARRRRSRRTRPVPLVDVPGGWRCGQRHLRGSGGAAVAG